MGAAAIAALALAGCGGGGSTPATSQSSNPPPPMQYTIGGSVTGLTGTGLVLQDNGGDNLSVTTAGSFTFATKVNSGANYSVTVMTQPSGQSCTVTSGTGTASGNVTNVAVACTNAASNVTISGSVTGLVGTGLVLQDNSGDDLSVTSNGGFTFATALASGASYSVTASTQPTSPTQTCTVTNGSGTATANITNVTVTCITSPGQFAYTADNNMGKIYAYTIDQTTGALTQVSGSPYTEGASPAAVSLSPNGKFAFSATDSGKKIYAFTVNQSTGQLTPVAGSPFATGFATGSTYPDIAVNPQSTYLYLASAGDEKVAGFAIDASSGVLTAVPGSPFQAGAGAGGIPAFSPNGNFLYVMNQSAASVSGYAISASNGALSPIAGSPFPAAANPVWIAFTPDGTFAYVSNKGGNSVSQYSVSAAGVLTALSPATVGTAESPEDLTVDSGGTHLYVPMGTGNTVGGVQVYTIGTGGTLTAAGGLNQVGIGPVFVDIDPSGQFAYVSSGGTGGTGVYGFSISATTGELTALTGSPWATGPAGSATAAEPQFLTIDPSGKFGYSADEGTGTVTGFAINNTTGALAQVPNSPYSLPGGKPFFVSISPEAPGIRD